jgi:hypothetical protein
LRLLHEIQGRFELREFETGAVGSPLRLLNTLEGKYDHERLDQHYKTKLFFCYGSKGMVNEICSDPEMVKRINAKLTEKNRGWTIDRKLSNHLCGPWNQPIYRLGIYANENNIGQKTRHYLSPQEVKDKKISDLNLTYAEAERIAKQQNVSEEDLNRRFRIQLSEGEEISSFGTNSSIERSESTRRAADFAEIKLHPLNHSRHKGEEHSEATDPMHIKKADTHFLETPLDYQKKIERIRWQPGKHFFQLHTKDICPSPYLDAVDELGLPQYSGISGSSDQTFTMAGILGIQSKEEMLNLRFAYLPWSLDTRIIQPMKS